MGPVIAALVLLTVPSLHPAASVPSERDLPRVGGTCLPCPRFDYGPFTPTAAWQTHSAVLLPGTDCAWYAFHVVAGIPYTFTTCPPEGVATWDTILELFDESCGFHASNDQACANASRIDWTATFTGQVRLKLRGFGGASGTYTLAYRTCAPSGLVVAPAGASTNLTNCSRTQDFAVAGSSGMALPVAWIWDVTPAAGGAAVPRSGTVTSGAPNGAATFRTTITGRGTHSVRVVARNSCGAAMVVQDYLLEDRSRPFVLAPPGTSVECPAAPPPASPVVRDNCDASPDVVLTEVTTPGPCPAAYSVRRTWIATDDAGNASAPARQVVTVTDRTPPVVTPDDTVAWCVFPPDHGRACFTFADFTPQAADACPGAISWVFARVTHDEEALGACDPPDGTPDVEIAPDGSSFCVRAERCVDDPLASPGRSYLVEAVATDACGNPSAVTPIAVVLVPQDSADTSACRAPVPW